MTVEEMRIQAQILTSLTINQQFVFRYINQALEILANEYDTACVKETITIVATKEVFYDINDKFIAVKKIIKKDTTTIDYDENIIDYELNEENKIAFHYDGTYYVTYLRYSKEVTENTETPEINRAYNNAITSYICSKERSRIFGKNDNDSQMFFQDFYSFSNSANTSLSRKKRTKRIMKAPEW